MSAAVAEARVQPSTRRPDVRRTTRRFAAVLVPVGPAAVGLLRYGLPYFTAATPRETADAVLADPGGQSTVLWLGLLATLTLVPGVLWVARLTRRSAPRLTVASLVLLIPGYLVLPLFMASDVILWAGADQAVAPAALGDLYSAVHGSGLVAAVIFVVGHVIGTILLGSALWRSRRVPTWAALLVIVSQPLYFVAAVILGLPTLDLAAWTLNAAGFAVAGIAIWRLRDDEWDLAPR